MAVRMRVGWRRRELARPRAYVVGLALTGVLFAAGAWAAMTFVPRLEDSPIEYIAPLVYPVLIPATWLVGWWLRARIAGAHGVGGTLGAAVLGVLMGSVIAGFLLTLFASLSDLVLSGPSATSLGILLVSPFAGFVAGAYGLWLLGPVTLPLGWLAVLLLRAASGGVVGESRGVGEEARRAGLPLLRS